MSPTAAARQSHNTTYHFCACAPGPARGPCCDAARRRIPSSAVIARAGLLKTRRASQTRKPTSQALRRGESEYEGARWLRRWKQSELGLVDWRLRCGGVRGGGRREEKMGLLLLARRSLVLWLSGRHHRRRRPRNRELAWSTALLWRALDG